MLDFRKLRFLVLSFFVSLLLYLPAYSQSTAYITDEDGDNVCVVDLDAETEIAVIGVSDGFGPYWIAASSSQNLVAASLHDDQGVALIDPVTNTLITNVAIPNGDNDSEPEAIAVNSTGTLVYVADEANNTLWVVDVVAQDIEAGPINLNPGDPVDCGEPENMVISPDDSTLYITCTDGEVVSVDTTSFDLTQIVDGPADHGIALNPAGTLLYYGDGPVIEYSIAGGAPTGTEYDGCDFYNGAISPSGDRLYCVEQGNDELFIFDTASGDEIENVDLDGNDSEDVAISCDGRFAYVPQDDFLEVVNTATFELDTIDYSCEDGRGIVILDSCPILNTPTLSEWGLLAMAGILGIIGLMVLRRRKLTA